MTDEITNLSDNSQTPRKGKLKDPDLNKGDFVFKVTSTVTVRVAAPPATGGQTAEMLFWQSIQDSKDAESYQAYLDQYPKGSFAGLARVRLNELKKTQTASLTPPSIQVEEVDASYVALKTANVRAEPSVKSDKVGRIARDSGVAVTGKTGKWLRVEQADGKTGYVFAALLALIDADEATAWAAVKDTKSPDEIASFLRSYPSGHFADRAKRLRAALTPQVATIRPPKVTAPSPATKAVGVYSARKPGDIFKDCDTCPKMVVIPAGRFRMGTDDGDLNQRPTHSVQIKGLTQITSSNTP